MCGPYEIGLQKARSDLGDIQHASARLAVGTCHCVRLQRSEQYFTLSQTVFHFFRQRNGRPQVAQIFVGKSDFFIGVQSS